MAAPITVIGEPQTPLYGDRVVLVEGTIGNTRRVDRDTVKNGDVFYLTFAAEKGKSAEEVAAILQDKYRIRWRHWLSPDDRALPPSGRKAADPRPLDEEFDFTVVPEESRHFLDERVRTKLDYFPDLSQLAFKFGNDADYFTIAFRFNPADFEKAFGDPLRVGRDDHGNLTGESIDTLKLDILQYQVGEQVLLRGAAEMAGPSPESRLPEVIHWGGLAITDRRDNTPERKPVSQFIAWLSDNHYAAMADVYEERVMNLSTRREEDPHVFSLTGYDTLDYSRTLKRKKRVDRAQEESDRHLREAAYLQFNNPNDIFEFQIAYQAKLHREGRLDQSIYSGDTKDHNPQGYHEVDHLLQSNTLPIAEELAGLPAAVTVGFGNHERLSWPPPADLMAGNYQMPKWVMEKITAGRNTDLINVLSDPPRSMEDDPRGLFPDLDLINRFPNSTINLKGDSGENPVLRPFSIGVVDTGRTDTYHALLPGETFYEREMQGVWASQFHYFHPRSAIRFGLHRSPDVEGTTEEEGIWIGWQEFDLIFGHAPDANAVEQREYDPGHNGQGIGRAKAAGTPSDVNFGTMAHNRAAFVAALHQSGNTIAYFSGHQHTLGNEFVTARNGSGKIDYFKLPFLTVMQQVMEDHEKKGDKTGNGAAFDFEKSLAVLWKPNQERLADPAVHPAVKQLYGKLMTTHHDIKVHLQLGSSGTGKNPHFAIFGINPNGTVSIKIKYVAKKLKQDKADPTGRRYFVEYKVADRPPGGNSRLVGDWDRLKAEDPKRWIDMSGSRERIAQRKKINTAVVPSGDSFKPYSPVIHKSVERDDNLPESHLFNQLRLYYLGNQFPGSTGDDIHLQGETLGFEVQASASVNLIDPKIRGYFLQGLTFGFRQDDAGKHRYHMALNLPEYLELKLSRRVAFRGANPRLGVSVVFPKPEEGESRYRAENAHLRFHRSLKILEGVLKWHPLEVSLGAYYDFTDDNQLLFQGGAAWMF